jgi:hypothetical protein
LRNFWLSLVDIVRKVAVVMLIEKLWLCLSWNIDTFVIELKLNCRRSKRHDCHAWLTFTFSHTTIGRSIFFFQFFFTKIIFFLVQREIEEKTKEKSQSTFGSQTFTFERNNFRKVTWILFLFISQILLNFCDVLLSSFFF